MSGKMSRLEATAMLIVLESSRRITKSNAPSAYVRQKLIGELEQELREAGCNIDAAIARVLELRKEERKRRQEEHRAREAQLRAEHPGLCDDCWKTSTRYLLPSRGTPVPADGLCSFCHAQLWETVR